MRHVLHLGGSPHNFFYDNGAAVGEDFTPVPDPGTATVHPSTDKIAVFHYFFKSLVRVEEGAQQERWWTLEPQLPRHRKKEEAAAEACGAVAWPACGAAAG
jgi:hypothetical protein